MRLQRSVGVEVMNGLVSHGRQRANKGLEAEMKPSDGGRLQQRQRCYVLSALLTRTFKEVSSVFRSLVL